jgi:hypothetical protein
MILMDFALHKTKVQALKNSFQGRSITPDFLKKPTALRNLKLLGDLKLIADAATKMRSTMPPTDP